ncbi:MAG TPA: recombinase family protein [Luteolibacter sp.]
MSARPAAVLQSSLADFAQLMRLFDKQNVSFVSVTQQFNTSSSMGRLTLNVLLSFAQFEREVTGERIRDKIALSKQKGMWMGGVPPLGYDVVERKLIINPVEAQVVRSCFNIYLTSRGLIDTVLELNRRGLKTKAFTSAKGRVQEPKPWIAKQLHRILTQPIYRGMVRHKEQLHSGEHEAIIDEPLWHEVQQKLQSQQPEFLKMDGHLNEIAISQTQLVHPLKGFLQGMDGQALTPTYTNKSQKRGDGSKVRKRYRYYVSQQAIRQGYATSACKTVNAELLEDAVRQMLAASLPKMGNYFAGDDLTPDQKRHRLDQHASRVARMKSPLEFARTIHALAPKIVVAKAKIQIHLAEEGIRKLITQPVDESPQHFRQPSFTVEMKTEANGVVVCAAVELICRRGRAEIVDGKTGKAVTTSRTDPKSTLIQTIVQAEYWRAELLKDPAATLHDLLRTRDLQSNYVRRLLNAAYLAPAIKQAIFQGTQPSQLQVQDLIKPRSMDWNVQMKELGFVAAETSACH